MKNHDRQHEPLDDAERDLQQRLRALPGGEPPPTLDRRILQAAQDAVAAEHPRHRRWRLAGGSAWRIGGAAAAALGLGIGLQALHQADSPLAVETPGAPTMQAPRGEESRLSVELIARKPSEFPATAPSPALEDTAALPARTAAAESSARPPSQQESRSMAAADAAPAPAPPLPPPEAFLDEPVDPPATAAAEAGTATGAPAPATALSAPVAKQSAPSAASITAARDLRGYDSRDLGRVRDDQQLPPTEWIARIQRRIDEGDLPGARASLDLLRERHPSQAIPERLLQRLRE